jgi:effector-binding domain-containing protein
VIVLLQWNEEQLNQLRVVLVQQQTNLLSLRINYIPRSFSTSETRAMYIYMYNDFYYYTLCLISYKFSNIEYFEHTLPGNRYMCTVYFYVNFCLISYKFSNIEYFEHTLPGNRYMCTVYFYVNLKTFILSIKGSVFI